MGHALAELERPECAGGRPGDGFLALCEPDLANREGPSSGGVLSSLLLVDPNLFLDPCFEMVGSDDALLPSPPAILRVSFGFLCAKVLRQVRPLDAWVHSGTPLTAWLR